MASDLRSLMSDDTDSEDIEQQIRRLKDSSAAEPKGKEPPPYDAQILSDVISLVNILPEPRIIFSLQGPFVRPWAPGSDLKLCRLVHSCPEGLRRCLASDLKLATAAQFEEGEQAHPYATAEE